MDRLIAHLQTLTDPTDGQGYLNGGVARIDASGAETAFLTGRRDPAPDAPRVSDPSLRLRMASISKAATARAAVDLASAGTLDLDGDLRDAMGWPDAPSPLHPVTPRMLLSHTSGLTDLGGYLPEPGTDIRDFIARNAAMAFDTDRGPGWFRYANLNYVLLGILLEIASGERFDRLLDRLVLGPAGIGGGFNWAGVAAPLRQHRLPLYQRRGDTHEPTADLPDADWRADLIWSGGAGHGFDDYITGRDTVLLSPHAGLRMNVVEAARLARHLGSGDAAGAMQRDIAWRFDPARPNGTDCGGLYSAFGLGLMIYRDHPRIAAPLIGHAGHALGFTGGVWHNTETGSSLAYFLTGSADLTDGLDDEVFYAEDELTFLNAV